jgi:DNA polymerase III sliding clamp (beta) subunit (PCNA family)
MDTMTDQGLALTIKPALLNELLTGALVATDKAAPNGLVSVLLVSDGQTLTATATDRYRLITGSVAVTGGAFTALISGHDITRIIKLDTSKDWPPTNKDITLSLIGDLFTASGSGNTITARVMSDRYPPYEQLFTRKVAVIKPAPVENSGIVIGLNSKLLATFDKVPHIKGQPMSLDLVSASDPVLIKIPHDSITWRAILMPMRSKP